MNGTERVLRALEVHYHDWDSRGIYEASLHLKCKECGKLGRSETTDIDYPNEDSPEMQQLILDEGWKQKWWRSFIKYLAKNSLATYTEHYGHTLSGGGWELKCGQYGVLSPCGKLFKELNEFLKREENVK